MPRGKIVLGLMLATIIIAAHHHALSQQFPYAAPQAPEFDDRGNLRGPGQSDAEPSQRIITPAPRTRERTGTQAPPGFGVVTPYAPEVTAPSQPAPPPQYGVTTPYAPEVAAPYAPEVAAPSQPAPPPSQQRQAPNYRPAQPAMPNRPQAQMPDRPDCSQYPMMIARARSEPEMQMTARQYLTCLLKSGWGMEQARAHVISTIESTYRLAR